MEELLDMRIRCPEHLIVSWVDIPPYIYNTSDGGIRGVFYEVVKDMVEFCCKDATTINYTQAIDGLGRLQDSVYNSSADVFFPLYGNNKKKFVLGQPFISVVESPGIAFFYGKESSAQSALINSFLRSWPVLVIILLSALVTGTCFWIMEIVRDPSNGREYEAKEKKNEKGPKAFFLRIIKGPCDGFYWAIVTLTTVGYGDYSPKSVAGRCLAMIWILFGTIILSMFTASITTGLITACMSNEISLAGSKVAVMENSKESYVATKKNAISIGTSSLEQLSLFLSHGQADGVLIDSYIAGHYQKHFEKFLLADIIEYVFTYGIVLKNKGMWLEKCFRLYPQIYRDMLFRKMSSSIIPFKPIKFGNQASEKSSSILNVRSDPIKYLLSGIGLSIFLLIAIGFVRERLLTRNTRKKLIANGNANIAKPFDDCVQVQKQRHLRETCETVQQIQGEIQTFHVSLDRIIKLGMKSKENYSFNHLNNGNEIGESFLTNGTTEC